MNVDFFRGFMTLGFFFGGLFFWHAWRQSKDRLFVFFAVGFWLMSLERLTWAVIGHHWREDPQVELRTAMYAVRFLAFVTIGGGIIDKNRHALAKKKERNLLRVMEHNDEVAESAHQP